MNLRQRLVERITTAVARVALAGAPALVTLSSAHRQEVDPLAVAGAASLPYAFWEQPSRKAALVGFGSAYTINVAGPDRFRGAAQKLRQLRSRTLQVAEEGAEGSPVLMGGFSFDEGGGWPGFPAGRLVLPELTLVRRDGQTVWWAATQVRENDSPPELADTLIDRLDTARSMGGKATVPGEKDDQGMQKLDLRDVSFLDKVGAAVQEVAGSRLSKVVVARRLAVAHRPRSGAFLAALRQYFPECAIFAFAQQESMFCGATPELLVRVSGVSVSTLALAGTAPRGTDPATDRRIALRLRSDPKEKQEHGYVSSEIRRRLDQGGLAVDPPAEMGVMKLPGIQHLATPITATAPVGTNVLDVAGVLHPTPAVAGIPTRPALDWIATHEGFDRGWFAGPVGFCDLAGQGEFHAALRSALIDQQGSALFAGAGIVGGSQPELELAETELKLGALLPLLLGS